MRRGVLARLNDPWDSGNMYGPYVARLDAKQQTGVTLLGLYITELDPSMARLPNEARAIFVPPGILK